MNRPLRCFIPAAGLGARLRPITNHIPKPLVPVLGKPVLETVLEKAAALPVDAIGVNLHYKREAIEAWLMDSAFRGMVELFPEDPILGTGGALKNAGDFLEGSAFLVHNSDIITDMDLGRLIEFHWSSGNLVTLAIHDFPRFNRVAVDSNGLLKGVGQEHALKQGGERWTAFTGVAVYSPGFLRFLPEGKSSVVAAWLRAAGEGHRVGTLDVSGCFWSDIGTPADYAAALVHFMRSDGEAVYIDPGSCGCGEATLDGCLVLERGSVAEAGSLLRNCIVLPGGRVAKGLHENCIIGPDFEIGLSAQEMGVTVENGRTLIGTGGSDRRYFRMRRDGGTAVLMQCTPGDPDFTRHIEYSRFFRRHGIPVPGLMESDPGAVSALFEDLGDMSLYNWLKCPRDAGRIEVMYRQVLDILVMIHTTATGRLSECPMLRERVFDYDHLRWETGYFLERFVCAAGRSAPRDSRALDEEFHRLAVQVDALPKTIVHRDFQSQNIMVKNDSARLIDYQGARIGPPAYDIASMLWDPYYRLDDVMRDRLVDYYADRMKDCDGGFNEDTFRSALLPCRLQRHMQALGAYGFLSLVKGKRYFLKHAPAAVRMLKGEAALAGNEYPELHRLVSAL